MEALPALRVLVLCTNSDEAGAPIHVQTLISSLKDRVLFFAVFGEEGPVAERLRIQGVSVEIVPEMRSSISLRKDFSSYLKLSHCVRKFRPDLMHVHSSKAGMLGRLLSLFHGVPCIYSVHGWGWRGLGKVSAALVYAVEKILAILVSKSHYIYVSRSVEREAQVMLGIPTQRGSVIYNGVNDVESAPQPEGPLCILMPARVTAAKDHESLVRAFEQLDFQVELLLCGTGTDSDSFLCQVREWAPTRHHFIRHLGQRSDVAALLHRTHVFALVSNFEALPLSIIEAMSAGKAIVASDVGGIGELIDQGVNGVLVKKNDVDGIAAAFSSLQSHDVRERLGATARETFQRNFTSKIMSASILQLYLDLQLGRK